ncbi:MAG: ABC transporter permease [Chloroflexota bacterium]
MSLFIAALSKELREQWRTYRFLVALVVLTLFGLTSPLLAFFTPQIVAAVPGAEAFAGLIPPPSVKDAIGQYIENLSQFAILLAILLPMGAVASEKERGTAALVLAKPLPRATFLLAKAAAYLLVFAACFLLAGLAGYYYTGLLFEFLPLDQWLAMNALLLLYVMVYTALTLLFSTLTRSQALAAGLSFAVLLALGVAGISPALAVYLPAQLVNWGASLWVETGKAHWGAVGVSAGIVVAALLAAWLAFRRQEL